jgi:cytochrome c oxidase assembly factor CtaG
MMMAPPLLLLGTPYLPLLCGLPRKFVRQALGPFLAWPALQRALRTLSHPIVAGAIFAVAMLAWHLPGPYQIALESPAWHQAEHLCFLVAGLLFWWPVVGLDPSPWRMPHPLRLLYLFVAGPVNTFTALAIYSATAVLYPFYTRIPRDWGPTPLQEQGWAGALMWITGDLILLVSVVIAGLAWYRHDQLETVRLDRRLDAERAAAGSATVPRRPPS